MKNGPKFKIARRLGAPIFEKTQTQKFALSQSRKDKGKRSKFPKKQTEFGLQLTEKQKARFSYLLSEKQFSNYVKQAVEKKGQDTVNLVYESLELRLDNAIFRMGFASTRAFARQVVSHGHVMVNGRRVNVPSYKLSVGDKISIREGSKNKGVFAGLDERIQNIDIPAWIKLDASKKEAVIEGKPNVKNADLLFDLNSVIEFYSR
jgi:small subunit ribosomal protein S4